MNCEPQAKGSAPGCLELSPGCARVFGAVAGIPGAKQPKARDTRVAQAISTTRFDEDYEQQSKTGEKGHHGGKGKWREQTRSDGLPKRLDDELMWEGGMVGCARGKIPRENYIIEEFAVRLALEDEAEV